MPSYTPHRMHYIELHCTQREKDYYSSINIENFIMQYLKPFLRCLNPQDTRNPDAIQSINPLIFKIVLKLIS